MNGVWKTKKAFFKHKSSNVQLQKVLFLENKQKIISPSYD